MACSVVVLAFLAGCGAQKHANDPRPPAPTRVSVSITRDALTVQPIAIGVGPAHTQQIPQNRRVPQPNTDGKAPLNVVFVVANLTDFDSRLEIRGPRDAASGPMVANGNGSYQVNLPTGIYTLAAADIPSARPAHLLVGPYRASSENDVLLP
jgi:hypothetical protein